ncbi:MAG: sigma-54-dependent Fis family transcriptional regulator [Pseudomonadales bacterium]|nr:sigma-54-dependent Fis family transcriptional regulator [Pseudomonadales bacterium]MCP5337429.1 sigma-54-dependent Fis family transcriptional regulator [Pseudomonadales bacterium]
MSSKRILIVDDEESIRFGIHDFLRSRGFRVFEAESCQQAREQFQAVAPDAAVIDFRLPDGTAIDLLHAFKQMDAGVPLIVLTAYGSIELAVEAVKQGAEQFLTKPIELPALLAILNRLFAQRRVHRQQQVMASREQRQRLDPFAGCSAAIRELAEQAAKVCAADRPILVLGETGTGKGLLANWLHQHGPRADEPFVDLNCAGLQPDFLETELFGHEKGAFTGAVAAKQGLFEVADGGTVFLDEIGDVDPRVQPKLLKVLEDKRFRRMGAVREREVDVALIAATHKDLAEQVQQGRFRSDLYFRISSIPLVMPALRERREDIPLLAEMLLSQLRPTLGRPVELAQAAVQALRDYPWPGNIRELRNVLEHAALLCERECITPRDLHFGSVAGPTPAVSDTSLTLVELERQYIESVLREEGGRVAQAALRLDVPRSTLYQKIKTYGIQVPQSATT